MTMPWVPAQPKPLEPVPAKVWLEPAVAPPAAPAQGHWGVLLR